MWVWSWFRFWPWSILQQDTIWTRSTVWCSVVLHPPCLDTLSCCITTQLTTGVLWQRSPTFILLSPVLTHGALVSVSQLCVKYESLVISQPISGTVESSLCVHLHINQPVLVNERGSLMLHYSGADTAAGRPRLNLLSVSARSLSLSWSVYLSLSVSDSLCVSLSLPKAGGWSPGSKLNLQSFGEVSRSDIPLWHQRWAPPLPSNAVRCGFVCPPIV